MTIEISKILEILGEHGIELGELGESSDVSLESDVEFPDVGEIKDGEAVYTTSLKDVLGDNSERQNEIFDTDDPRIREWWDEIEKIRRGEYSRRLSENNESPEPHCAWYCPIHFFGHGWGIYIRESCVLASAREIATYIDWSEVHASRSSIARQLWRSAFYLFFLHEQFHHKVESLGFRLLVSSGMDRYRPYKSKVYRATYLTPDCLEESLANAESYRRLSEKRYTERVDRPFRDGLRAFLETTMPRQAPGYAEGVRYFSERTYRDGLYKLQSQVLDASLVTSRPTRNWSVAPNMITALTDIIDEIYVVLPKGARPIFAPSSVDPGPTVSTSVLASALTKHYGYQHVVGGKGSHIKLKKPGAQTIILPGNRPVLSPGVVKHALDAVGGHPISRLPDLISGSLLATT